MIQEIIYRSLQDPIIRYAVEKLNFRTCDTLYIADLMDNFVI